MNAPPDLNAPSESLRNRVMSMPSIAVFSSPKALSVEVLAGIITTLALIPEVISFSVIAGVKPEVSLIASVILAITMSFLGGRPAMVTAAAGSVALVVAPLVKSHGVEYLLPAVILAGFVQIVFGVTGLARLMQFIPRSVMIGFVNALAILIFMAQIRHLVDVPWLVYPLFILTILIVVILPRLTRAVPAALVAIVVVTAIVILTGMSVPSVGDGGSMSGALPGMTPFLAPISLETLQIVWPTALSIAFVGLLESLLTAKVVDDLTGTGSSKARESWALGVANLLAGLFGGIAGCAMIGQTVVNVKLSRARTRISTLVAGATLLLLVTTLSGVMARIPMVALAAVMMIVAISTMNWGSVSPLLLKRMPLSETIVMAATVAVVVATGNLAVGVAVGVVLALALFARRVARNLRVDRTVAGGGTSVRYKIHGPLFFGSSNALIERFAFAHDPKSVIIDLTHAQIWDASSVAVLDAIETKYQAQGSAIVLEGLDERSHTFRARISGQM